VLIDSKKFSNSITDTGKVPKVGIVPYLYMQVVLTLSLKRT
jgi:hypothetical protein